MRGIFWLAEDVSASQELCSMRWGGVAERRSVFQTVQRRMVEWIQTNELAAMCKQATVPYLAFSWTERRKSYKILHDSCPRPDTNTGPLRITSRYSPWHFKFSNTRNSVLPLQHESRTRGRISKQEEQCAYDVTLWRVRRGKAISVTYWSVRACVNVVTRARRRAHAHKCM